MRQSAHRSMDAPGLFSPRASLDEEMPTMRSVAIMGAPMGAAPLGIAPLRRGDLIETKQGKVAGVGPLSRVGGVAKRSKAGPVSQKKWMVSKVEQIPDDFPLEKTSRHIRDADCSLVATRISDCLRLRSIEAEYNDDEGKAKCRTADFVSFRIKLFAGTEGGVVVEVQRRRGSSFSFMRDCRAILDAAEGGGVSPASESDLPYLKRPVSDMSCLKGVKLESTNDVEAAEDLLQEDRRDANMLGMESLEDLTNPLTSSPDAVRRAAKSVLCAGGESQIRDSISSLLKFSSLKDERGTRQVDEDKEDDYDERMHNLSLSVVYNAFSVMVEDGSLSSAFKTHEQWFLGTLVPVLIHDVKCFEERPHDACLAAKCMQCFAACTPVARETITEAGALDALASASDFGTGYHASLAQEAKRAANSLKCS